MTTRAAQTSAPTPTPGQTKYDEEEARWLAKNLLDTYGDSSHAAGGHLHNAAVTAIGHLIWKFATRYARETHAGELLEALELLRDGKIGPGHRLVETSIRKAKGEK